MGLFLQTRPPNTKCVWITELLSQNKTGRTKLRHKNRLFCFINPHNAEPLVSISINCVQYLHSVFSISGNLRTNLSRMGNGQFNIWWQEFNHLLLLGYSDNERVASTSMCSTRLLVYYRSWGGDGCCFYGKLTQWVNIHMFSFKLLKGPRPARGGGGGVVQRAV